MTKYKIGDRVVLTETTDALPGVPSGGLGTVGELRDGSVFPYRVRWDAAPGLGFFPDKGALVRNAQIREATDEDAPTVRVGDRVRYVGTSNHALGVTGVAAEVTSDGMWVRIDPDEGTSPRNPGILIGVFAINVVVVEPAPAEPLAEWERELLAEPTEIQPTDPTAPIDPALRERMLVLALEHGWVDPDITAAHWAAFITTGATS